MSQEYDVGIYMRCIQLNVVVPEEYVWEFMKEFGEAFATKNPPNIRPVDDYYDHPNGWHVLVSVGEHDEQQLDEFVRTFASARNLAFKHKD